MNRHHFIKRQVAGTAILATSGLVYKASSYSTTRKFYSEGEGVSNHLPYAATLIGPTLNSKL